mmetsp:Transcript_39446/g.95438  ORF Transcript_39446/g.95438 Transcript_39446/m.95438 type:complete len:551 (-) Transcript_39446:78-1730(-)
MSGASDEEPSRPNKRSRKNNSEGNVSSSSRHDTDNAENERIEFIYTGQSVDVIPRNITHLTVDSSVREIEESAFESCEDLVSAIIPKTVKVIGEKAFYGCVALVNVKLHRGLRTISPMAFACCIELVEIVLPKTLKIVGDVAFGRCESLKTFAVPHRVENVGMSWFWGCHYLVEVRFHNGIKTIRRGAFYECKSLCIVNFPQLLETIGQDSFEGCTALSALAFPPTLEEIESRAFASCEGLITVEVPPVVQMTIGSESFAGCTALMNVSVPAATQMADDAFSGCYLLNGAAGDDEDANTLLRDRFENLPIHKVLYQSLGLTQDDLIRVLDDSSDSRDELCKDAFGLTPLHIMAASLSLRENILECLLNWYPLEAIVQRDSHGLRMMDYLLWNTSDAAVSLIKMILCKTMIATISSWRGGAKSESELISRLESMHVEANTREKIEHLHDFLGHAGYYVRLQPTSILELALWKWRMGTTVQEAEDGDDNYRQKCRCQSGADVVIENVAEFLWLGKTRACTALRLYPLSAMVLGSEIMFRLDDDDDDSDNSNS